MDWEEVIGAQRLTRSTLPARGVRIAIKSIRSDDMMYILFEFGIDFMERRKTFLTDTFCLDGILRLEMVLISKLKVLYLGSCCTIYKLFSPLPLFPSLAKE